jgi:hypothetical protein
MKLSVSFWKLTQNLPLFPTDKETFRFTPLSQSRTFFCSLRYTRTASAIRMIMGRSPCIVPWEIQCLSVGSRYTTNYTRTDSELPTTMGTCRFILHAHFLRIYRQLKLECLASTKSGWSICCRQSRAASSALLGPLQTQDLLRRMGHFYSSTHGNLPRCSQARGS